MTTIEYSKDIPLTDQQISELEAKIADGDLKSMMSLTYDALQHHLDDAELLERRKWLVLKADNKGDRQVLRNVAFLAAQTDDVKMTDFLIPLLFEVGDIGTAYRVSRILEKSTKPESVETGGVYLQESTSRGYFPARSWRFRLNAKRLGVLGHIGWAFYVIYLTPQIVWIRSKNQNDPRTYPW